ncbi:MAG: hypothetical protein JOZ80_18230 [Acidobacteriaceae bacterium]|nr:hypothetical protein [Acidobacteriaceae bacterium]
MLQMVTRLRQLLALQLQASHGSIGEMSEVDWQQYEARDKEIAALMEALQSRKPVVQ